MVIVYVFMTLVACLGNSSDPVKKKRTADTISAKPQPQAEASDSLNEQKLKLTPMYCRAISDFIRYAFQRKQLPVDTLFFGKHVYGQEDDFPDIQLPEKIEGVPIRLISPEIGLRKQKDRLSMIYINMMGWVDTAKAEFIFVVFSNGGAHQYDYFIDYAQRNNQMELALDTIQFDDYIQSHNQKPKRELIYPIH